MHCNSSTVTVAHTLHKQTCSTERGTGHMWCDSLGLSLTAQFAGIWKRTLACHMQSHQQSRKAGAEAGNLLLILHPVMSRHRSDSSCVRIVAA